MATPFGTPASGGLHDDDFNLFVNSVPAGGTVVFAFYGFKAAGSVPDLTPTVLGSSTATAGPVVLDFSLRFGTAFGDVSDTVRIIGFGRIPILTAGRLDLLFPAAAANSATAIACAYTEALPALAATFQNGGNGAARSSSGSASISSGGTVFCFSVGDGSGDVTYTATSGDPIDSQNTDTSLGTQTMQRRNMASAGAVSPAMVVTSDQTSPWLTITAVYPDGGGGGGSVVDDEAWNNPPSLRRQRPDDRVITVRAA